MKVGFIGLGKLGLPVAVAMALKGHDVMGVDLDTRRMSYAPQPYLETGPDGTGDFNEWLAKAVKLRFGTVEQVIDHAQIVFLAVQTPHDERFDGTRPLEESPVDFDYTALKEAVSGAVGAKQNRRPTVLSVISTVLPGTMAREIKPLLTPEFRLTYNPFFIAMGTVMHDFLNPEFVLLGVDDGWAAEVVEAFYRETLPGIRVMRMSVPSAEATKVFYNTYISTKISVANAIMEACHKIPGANCDDVATALEAANQRITSPAYMRGGMGDGGGCHPRDNIALSWLAKKLNMHYDPFSAAMSARERQSIWLRDTLIHAYIDNSCARMMVAGYAFKPGTNITTGSPALLLVNQIEAMGYKCLTWDPHVDRKQEFPLKSLMRLAILIGCRHPEFEGWTGEGLAHGSVIIDPHRITGTPVKGVKIIRLGEGKLNP